MAVTAGAGKSGAGGRSAGTSLRRAGGLRPLHAAILAAVASLGSGAALADRLPLPAAIPSLLAAATLPAVESLRSNPRREVYFIDSGVEAADTLRRAIPPGAEVVVLDPARSGVEQIAALLAGRTAIDALHIVSHGGAGYIRLGGDILSPDTIEHHRAAIAGWRAALAEGADILLYGCEVAGSAEGRQLVERIGAITGADLAASVDLTGADRLKGDWDLEYRAGRIDTAALDAPRFPGTLATITVDGWADTVGNDGRCVLREAIVAANTNASYYECSAGIGNDTIQFDSAVFTGAPKLIGLTGPLPQITSNITIKGDAGTGTTIQAVVDAQAAAGIFDVAGVGALTLDRMDLRNADDSAVYVAAGGSLSATASIFSDNQAEIGAAIRNAGQLTVTGSRFYGNQASYFGGAIDNGGTATVSGSSLFADNSVYAGVSLYTPAAGGAISNRGGTLGIADSSFLYNWVYSWWEGSYGGAVANGLGNSLATISDSGFFYNGAYGFYWSYGGGVDNQGTLALSGSYFGLNIAWADGPYAQAFGGGLATYLTGSATVDTSDFVGNAAVIAVSSEGGPKPGGRALAGQYQLAVGGGAANIGGSLAVYDTYFGYNVTLSATYYGTGPRGPEAQRPRRSGRAWSYALDGVGGGAASLDGATTLAYGSVFYSNYSFIGGGVANYASGLTLGGVDAVYNYAYIGGGVANIGTLSALPRAAAAGTTITGSVFGRNIGVIIGGGIANLLYGQMAVDTSLLYENGSYYAGAGVGNIIGSMTLADSALVRNYTYYVGGGALSLYGDMAISGSTLAFNYAYLGGGMALFQSAGAVANSTFSGNAALYGQGVLQSDYGMAPVLPKMESRTGGFASLAGRARHRTGTGVGASGHLQAAGGFSRATGISTLEMVNSTVYAGAKKSASPAIFPRHTGKVLDEHGITVQRDSIDRADLRKRLHLPSPIGSLVAVAANYTGSTAAFANTLVGGGYYGNCLFYGVTPTVTTSLADDGSCTGFAEVAALGLGALADNGGPTYTHALLTGSPAIDAGTDSAAAGAGLATDQRGAGFPRISGALVDVGAFELAQPMLAVLPNPFDFGIVQVGVASTEETFTLTNSGDAPADVSSLISGDPAVFAVTSDNCTGATLAAGGDSCTFGVVMTPAAPGFDEAPIDIATSPAFAGLGVYNVSGTGALPAISLSATGLDFGSVALGVAGTPQPLVIENAGLVPVALGTLSTGGAYTLSSDPCSGQTIAVGGDCTVQVTFTPAALGAANGALAIPSNAEGAPHSVGLTGIGIQGGLSLDPTRIDFGSRILGSTSGEQIVDVTNNGTGPVAIGDIGGGALGRSISGDFAISSDACSNQSLTVGATCQVGVTFTPTALGSRTGELTIPNDAPGNPHAVSLAGMGHAPASEPRPIPVFGWVGQLLATLLLGGLGVGGLRRRRRIG